MLHQSFALIICSYGLLARAAIYQSSSELRTKTFDFIIVGGGTAGSVLANRLTENPDFEVLVLEAGISNANATPTMIPFFCTRLSGSLYDWNFTTVPQRGLDSNVITFPRGHLLGGSSSINGMFYTRGSAEDYDRFARVADNPGWSWKRLMKYILKNEKWTPPSDNHNTTGQFNPVFHSTSGINSVSLPGFPQAINDRILKTTTELRDEFPFNLDMNSGKPLGLGWLQATIKGGSRSSSATSYLTQEVTGRKNLHIVLNTQVSRVLQSQTGGHGRDSFRTVEFAPKGQLGSLQTLTASKELILSAGAVGTPHILLNSGIGDPKDLDKLVVNLPDVGKNLVDHPRLVVNWIVTDDSATFDEENRNGPASTNALQEWQEKMKGPFVDTFVSHLAFQRLSSNATIFRSDGDPSAGPESAHIELGISNGFVGPTPGTGSFLGMTMRVVSPTSRGTVKINGANPFSAPLIDPAYLTTDFDIFAIREAFKSAQRFLAAPVWKGYVLKPFGAFANVTTDDEIDQAIRNQTGTSAHPVGTASMSAQGARGGVVDPNFRVKGLEGLRVVDASVFPFIPSAHLQAPTYAIAEWASDLIKSSW